MKAKPIKQLTVAELGTLGTCHNCGCSTFTPKTKNDGRPLPKGFTMGNSQRTVRVRGVVLHVCQNCRYDAYGRY